MAVQFSIPEQLENELRRICGDSRLLRSKARFDASHHSPYKSVKATLWIDEFHAQAELRVHQVAQSCTIFIGEGHQRLQAWIFNCSKDEDDSELGNYILVAEIDRPSDNGFALEKLEPPKSSRRDSWWANWNHPFKYDRLDSEGKFDQERCHFDKRSRSSRLELVLGLMAFALVTTFAVSMLWKPAATWPEDGYIRYPTPGSDGPKYQTQIYYYNATEWSRNNPHDHGEWKIRMDDQSLIPAAAWDDDEDRYQQWYHARYDVMRDVIRTRKFLRPSWLGSMGVIVPWDKEFHMAHCVLTLRRYWKAKETGKHVCPRDIDFNHIQHCLNWFDGLVFSEDAEGVPDMGSYMIWQTKVCF